MRRAQLPLLGARIYNLKHAYLEANMAPIDVRLGDVGDVDDAVSVYERSNLARRQGIGSPGQHASLRFRPASTMPPHGFSLAAMMVSCVTHHNVRYDLFVSPIDQRSGVRRPFIPRINETSPP